LVTQRYGAAFRSGQGEREPFAAGRPSAPERVASGLSAAKVTLDDRADRAPNPGVGHIDNAVGGPTSVAVSQRGEYGSKRWRRLTTFALVSVVVWTVVLGLMLTPRWMEFASLATSAPNKQPITLPATPVERAKEPPRDPALPTATVRAGDQQEIVLPAASIDRAKDFQRDAVPALAGVQQHDLLLATTAGVANSPQADALPESAARQLIVPMESAGIAVLGSDSSISSGKLATARPRAYSSIDAQTLVAARTRGEELAGKRAPVSDSAPLVDPRDTAIPAVVAGEAVSRHSGLTDLPRPSGPPADVSQSSAASIEPRPGALPRHGSSTPESRRPSQSLIAQAASPRVPIPRTASPHLPMPRGEFAQSAPSTSTGEGKRIVPIARSDISQQPTNPRSDPSRVVRLAPANAATPSSVRSEPMRIARSAPADGTNSAGSRSDPPRVLRSAATNEVASPNPRPEPPRVVRSASANETVPNPRPESHRVVRSASARGATVPNPRPEPPKVVSSAPAIAADGPADRNASVALGLVRPAPPSPQQDAASARLDDSWERRERWLRERLQTR